MYWGLELIHTNYETNLYQLRTIITPLKYMTFIFDGMSQNVLMCSRKTGLKVT